jgi:porin
MISSLWAYALAQSVFSIESLNLNQLEKFRRYLNPELYYTHDYISNVGGAKSGPRNIGAIDLYLESNLKKYSSINAEFRIHYIHINQNDQRGAIGDYQYASNIDMPVQVDRLGDFWYQQNWESFDLLVGIHDFNTEFNYTENALQFLNTSFGIAADISMSGKHGASVYPLSTPGIRARLHLNKQISLLSGIYHANVGDYDTYRKVQLAFGGPDGFMHISELIHGKRGNSSGIGFWHYTTPQEQFIQGKGTSYGFYGNLERKLGYSLRSFIRYSLSNPKINDVQSNLATGVSYRGIFQRKRNEDEVGIGLTTVHFSSGYLEENEFKESNETAYEVYYDFKLSKNLGLRPDIQYIQNPSGNQDLKNAWAIGFRSSIEL